VNWLLRSVLALIGIYGVASGFLAYAMSRPPEDFGQIMKRLPQPLVFGVLPAAPIWMWARQGRLVAGDVAPDFTAPLHDHSGTVTLSSFRGRQPVVLVFGSYT
jgi:hypothetical protein